MWKPYVVLSFSVVIALVLLTVFYDNSIKKIQPPEPIKQDNQVKNVLNQLFRSLTYKSCDKPSSLYRFSYDEKKLGFKTPRFALEVYLPTNLMPADENENERGSNYVRFPLGGKQTHLVISVFSDVDFEILLDYYLDAMELSRNILKISKFTAPESVYDTSISEIPCIDSFLKNVDALYIVQPTDRSIYNLFEINGIAHQPGFESEDLVYAPFGFYAVKYEGNKTTLLHVLYDQDYFANTNLPYSVDDIIWSLVFQAYAQN